MISLYHAAAVVQTQVNNDLGRAHDTLIGRSTESNVKSICIFHTLPSELHESLIAVGRGNVSRSRKPYEQAAKQQKEEIAMEHKLDRALENVITAIYFHE